ncbi:PfkB family carbohydrate kinase [Estrella lausannensis]|uniref:Kinase, pfkB family n=1 Tax=Estrella lausannensis TaxID=483423 RepID=A0A0H5DQN6_9BACT|nr:PfkB family carbohydrate kinase [Estrella lausannensis]CRX38857.1 Kinase, pfkB family [Estrella lausannensis]
MKERAETKSNKIHVVGDSYLELISEQKGASLSSNDTFLKGFGGEGFLLAVALARLKTEVSLCSLIGSDPFGEALLNQLVKEGVQTKACSGAKTPIRFISFESKDKTATLIYADPEQAGVSLPKECGSALVLFLKSPKAIEQLKATTAELPLRKQSGEKLILILPEEKEELSDEHKATLWPLIEQADLFFSFGKRSTSFLSTMDLALKTGKTSSYVIERHPGVFELSIHGQRSNFSLGKKTAAIPGEEHLLMIAAFITVYMENKQIQEGMEILKKADARVVERIPLMNILPYLENLKNGKNERQQASRDAISLGTEDQGLCFLTFDQIGHFEELARKHRRSETSIAKFKDLIYQAFLRTAATAHHATLGVCVDNCHGEEILAKALAHHYSIIRTVDEHTKKVFEEHPYGLIRSWPRKEIVKVLLNLRDGELPSSDIRWMQRLFEAVEETGHQLLVEIYDKERNGREERVLAAINSLYQQDIHPTLWKLQPSFDLDGWRHIEQTIDKHDKQAGILVLGDRRPLKELAKDLKGLKESIHKVKGFAIGRSLWQHVAEHWFEKRISDEMVESEVAYNFRRLLTIWENPATYHEEEFDDTPLEHMKR